MKSDVSASQSPVKGCNVHRLLGRGQKGFQAIIRGAMDILIWVVGEILWYRLHNGKSATVIATSNHNEYITLKTKQPTIYQATDQVTDQASNHPST